MCIWRQESEGNANQNKEKSQENAWSSYIQQHERNTHTQEFICV